MSDPYRSICEKCAREHDNSKERIAHELQNSATVAKNIAIVALGVVFWVASLVLVGVCVENKRASGATFFAAPALYIAFWAIYTYFSTLKAAKSLAPGKY